MTPEKKLHHAQLLVRSLENSIKHYTKIGKSTKELEKALAKAKKDATK